MLLDRSLMAKFLTDPGNELLVRILFFVKDSLEDVEDEAEASHLSGLVGCKRLISIKFILKIFEFVKRALESLDLFHSKVTKFFGLLIDWINWIDNNNGAIDLCAGFLADPGHEELVRPVYVLKQALVR